MWLGSEALLYLRTTLRETLKFNVIEIAIFWGKKFKNIYKNSRFYVIFYCILLMHILFCYRLYDVQKSSFYSCTALNSFGEENCEFRLSVKKGQHEIIMWILSCFSSMPKLAKNDSFAISQVTRGYVIEQEKKTTWTSQNTS